MNQEEESEVLQRKQLEMLKVAFNNLFVNELNHRYDTESKEIKDKVSSLDETILAMFDTLSVNISKVDDNVKSVRDMHEKFEDNIKSFNKDISKVNANVNSVKDMQKTIDEKLKSLDSSVTANEKKVANISNLVDELDKKFDEWIQSLENEFIGKLTEKLTETNSEITSIKSKAEELAQFQHIEDLQKKIKNISYLQILTILLCLVTIVLSYFVR